MDLAGVKGELRRLRQGQGLAQPQVVLGLSPDLCSHMTGPGLGSDSEAQVAVAVVSALDAAIDRLSGPDRMIARAEFNLDIEHAYLTLTERQESLAVRLCCTAKTVRRRSDRALDSLALIIAAGAGLDAPSTAEPTRFAEPAETVGGEVADGRTSGNGDPGGGRDVDEVLRRFWRLSPGSRVDVVCSEIPPEEAPNYAVPGDRNYLRYAKFADLDTLIYVRTRLAQLAPTAAVRDFSPSEHHDTDAGTMIVIGGPPWNAKYREFLPQLPFYFEPHPLGEDDPLVIPQLGDLRLGPRWTPRAELVEDVAVFARLTLTSGTTAVLLGGCLTLGVLGAAKLFLHGELGVRSADWVCKHAGDGDVVVVTEARRVGGMTDVAGLAESGPLVALGRTHPGQLFSVLADNSDRYPS